MYSLGLKILNPQAGEHTYTYAKKSMDHPMPFLPPYVRLEPQSLAISYCIKKTGGVTGISFFEHLMLLDKDIGMLHTQWDSRCDEYVKLQAWMWCRRIIIRVQSTYLRKTSSRW